MRVWIYGLIVSASAVGCATAGEEPTTTDRQGIAELRVDAAPLLASGITRVTVDGAGQSSDLVQNPATGTFDGTVFLPAGTQRLVASAFSDDVLVAQSRPTQVAVQAGIVTRIEIRILDLTPQGPPLYGPIFDSLSFPTTTQAGASVTFSISVVAPAGDPVTYAWSSSCPDATFSAPGAATTSWSKAAQGACTITAVGTSNGIPVVQSFVIAVFPAGSGSGAVDVSGVLVTAPALGIFLPGAGCNVFAGGNASCPLMLASPATTSYEAEVFNWGSSTPGTLEVSDNCGGRFGTASRNPGDVSGSWLPPVGGGLCILTMRAVNGDGLASTLSAAILTRSGTPATAQPPQLFVSFDNGCAFQSSATPTDCGSLQAGGERLVFGNVFWADGLPGSVTIADDCAGAQPDAIGAFFSATWSVPTTPGRACTTTVRATNLQGASTELAARYQLFGP